MLVVDPIIGKDWHVSWAAVLSSELQVQTAFDFQMDSPVSLEQSI